MKKTPLILIFLISASLFSSCQASPTVDIVTTMFPQYDFVRAIVKDKLSVSLLLPPGAEVHDFEASSKNLIEIKQSKLFIYTSPQIDPWVGDETTIGGPDTIVMNLENYSGVIQPLFSFTPFSLINETSDEVHFWTDPIIAINLIEEILIKIIALDPENTSFYETNANEYMDALLSTYEDFSTYLSLNNLLNSTLFFAGHNAVGAFGSRHNLEIVSLFENFIPDEDLTSAQLITFVNEIKTLNISYLFTEELHEPKAATTIKNELIKEDYSLTLLELHGYHNLTPTDFSNDVTYLDLYERNITNIKLALGAL